MEGYHRLWSHKSFIAKLPLRIALAAMGTLGFQGSIRYHPCFFADDSWWVLRHRLHHCFTDTESDPYSADKGLFYSHVGWIFVKERYAALKLVDKRDLDQDPVVRFQHQWFVPLALLGGLLLPALVGHYWIGNWKEGIIWGGFVARIAIWHCTYILLDSSDVDS
jgi:stearoyl-CoA desaturase (delta-9 desaturase)